MSSLSIETDSVEPLSDERQPRYLEIDSPAVKGDRFFLDPDERLFAVPAKTLTDDQIDHINRYPRSPTIDREQRLVFMETQEAMLDEKRALIDLKVRLRMIDNARKEYNKKLMSTHKPMESIETRIERTKFKLNMPGSLAQDSRAFLMNGGRQGKIPDTMVSRNVNNRLNIIREDLQAGRTSLRELRHEVKAPTQPKPSSSRPSNNMLGESDEDEEDSREEIEADLGLGNTEETITTYEKYPEWCKVSMQLIVNCNFWRVLTKNFNRKKAIYLYEDDAHAIAQCRRIQLWYRHLKIRAMFLRCLRSKALILRVIRRWMKSALYKKRNRCATLVLAFFRDCFEVGRFRMSMKIFIFRVIRLQKVMRSFLACNRERNRTMFIKFKQFKKHYTEYPPQSRLLKERCIHFIVNNCPELINEHIIKKYRRPYAAARWDYNRALKSGDMTRPFKELDVSKIRVFLDLQSSDHPPQYEEGEHEMPVFVLYSRTYLHEDFEHLIEETMDASKAYHRQVAQAEKDKKQAAELEAAYARGEGQQYQMKLIKERQTQDVDPHENYEKAMDTFKDYFKARHKDKAEAANAAKKRGAW